MKNFMGENRTVSVSIVVMLIASLFFSHNESAAYETWTDRPGKDYRSFWISKEIEGFVAVQQCKDACKNEPQCKAFTYVMPGVSGDNGRCYLKDSVPSRVDNKCCTSGVVRPETKADNCNNYALDAVQSSKSNVNYNCGYIGNMWSDNFKLHYDWCMTVSEKEVEGGTSERKRLMAQCTQPPEPSTSGDLSAHDMCYFINYGGGEVTFYPIVKNVGSAAWRSKKKGYYKLGYRVNSSTSKERKYEIPLYPYWELGINETKQMGGGATLPYHPDNKYSFDWMLWHDEDINPSNNMLEKPFDTFSTITGRMLDKHQWLLSKKACNKIEPKHQPLNLYWDSEDLNQIPMNPKWGWQLEHSYGASDYYPDIPWLTPLLQLRIIDFLGVKTVKLGEERDFSKATNQEIFREYGQSYIPKLNVPLPFKCGPHVNWIKIPVTFDGNLLGADYDGDDCDINFYLFPLEGAGAVNKNDQIGGIKVEFNSKETVDNFDTPWWSNFDYDGYKNNHDYAIVTGLFGLDCAHECDSELHPAYAMAIRVKENDPNDDVYAMFVRNWGNEGYCSDNIFTIDFPPEGGDQNIYKFLLPWRPEADSVTVTDKQFKQVGDVAMKVSAIPNKGVQVTFALPAPEKRPLINGELHLKWSYAPGVSAKPYNVPATAVANAAAASPEIVLEDTEMNQRILEQLPIDKQLLFKDMLREINAKNVHPILDGEQPKVLDIKDTELVNIERPKIQVVPDVKKMNLKREILKKLDIQPVK